MVDVLNCSFFLPPNQTEQYGSETSPICDQMSSHNYRSIFWSNIFNVPSLPESVFIRSLASTTVNFMWNVLKLSMKDLSTPKCFGVIGILLIFLKCEDEQLASNSFAIS